MNRDKVTVLLPVYNCESYVDECIKSIRDQTYKNLEILIINDGSMMVQNILYLNTLSKMNGLYIFTSQIEG